VSRSEDRRLTRKRRRVVFALFFFSGISGLIYEVVWVRQLSLIFGVSVYAVSAVLTAYMGGLALGGYASGRWVDRLVDRRRVLRAYGSLEMGIGLTALLLPLALSGVTGLYVWMARYLGLSFYALSLIRLVLSLLALIVPTTLMGATLPVLSRFLVEGWEQRGLEIGGLYAVNTLGAVLGASAAGLFLIRLLGVVRTTWLAAAINLLVGAAAWGLARTVPLSGGQRKPRSEEREDEPDGKWYSPQLVRLVLIGFALSGFASLGYEVLWSRILTIHSSNAIYSFSIMLSIFLAGLALGGWVSAQRVDRGRQLVWAFGLLELAIGVSAVLFLLVFAKLPTISLRVQEALGPGLAPFSAVVFEYAIALSTIFGPTLLIGAVFPIVSRICSSGKGHIGRAIGDIYAFNTLGAILGSLVAGFLLISVFGLQRSVILLAMLNLFVGSAALLLDTHQAPSRVRHTSSAPTSPQSAPVRTYGPIMLAVVLVAAIVSSLPRGMYLGFREGPGEHLIFYKEGIDATVAVFHVEDRDFKVSFVNGRMEVPTDELSMQTFHLLGQLPLLLHPDPREVLVLSFGNGIVSGSIARHAGVKHIRAVDLSSEMIEASARYSEENNNILEDERLHIVIEDARNHLLRSTERYDVITADATHPMNSCSWALFTRQFYQLGREHLKPRGIMVQWLPLHDLALSDYKRIVKTFKSVFPNTTLWQVGHRTSTHTLLLGTPDRLRLDLSAIDAKLGGQAISPLLGKAEALPTHFLMDGEAIDHYTAGVGLVTDDSAYFMPKEDVRTILASFALHRVDAPVVGQ
jgi:spermidine synthase